MDFKTHRLGGKAKSFPNESWGKGGWDVYLQNIEKRRLEFDLSRMGGDDYRSLQT